VMYDRSRNITFPLSALNVKEPVEQDIFGLKLFQSLNANKPHTNFQITSLDKSVKDVCEGIANNPGQEVDAEYNPDHCKGQVSDEQCSFWLPLDCRQIYVLDVHIENFDAIAVGGVGACLWLLSGQIR
jgi:hypothetical protein